ncbi:MAG: dephospho-CoA kinase [Candidatus Melainabacteria bacterium]|jgi:dephospho-CoA kinase
MIKLGITGNIACGKSSIGQYLNEIGFDFIDSDEVVHSILSVKSEATERLIVLCKPYEIRSAAFLKGEENNSNRNESVSFIDRRKLGALLFRNNELKKKIESIIHPLVFEKTNEFFQEQELKGAKLAANLIPLLFESKSQNRFDCIWLIYCTPSEQKARLELRNSQLSEAEIDLRIKSQMSQEEKKKLVDFVIDNSDSLERTFEQVDSILKTNLKVIS